MKVALVALLLAATVSIASAQGGMNLFWNGCSVSGQDSRVFACNTNAGANFLFVSVVPPHDMPNFSGVWFQMRIAVDDVSVPPWWQTTAQGCRPGALQFEADPLLNGSSCPDIWQGARVQAYIAIGQDSAPYRLRMDCLAQFWDGVNRTLAADGTEYHVARFRIGHEKTVGTGSCAGCTAGACIVLGELRLLGAPGLGDVIINNPAAGNWVTWQGSGSPQCPQATPTHNRTWGAVKELYR